MKKNMMDRIKKYSVLCCLPLTMFAADNKLTLKEIVKPDTSIIFYQNFPLPHKPWHYLAQKIRIYSQQEDLEQLDLPSGNSLCGHETKEMLLTSIPREWTLYERLFALLIEPSGSITKHTPIEYQYVGVAKDKLDHPRLFVCGEPTMNKPYISLPLPFGAVCKALQVLNKTTALICYFLQGKDYCSLINLVTIAELSCMEIPPVLRQFHAEFSHDDRILHVVLDNVDHYYALHEKMD